MLLPWHAAGTLSARDARRVDEALAQDPELARQYSVIREEYAETIHLNESLGAPSVRAMQKLFDAIDGEPVRKPSATSRIATRIAEFFSGLSPRTMAWSAGAAALALLLQAGVIGIVLIKNQNASYQTASLDLNDRAAIVRDVGAGTPPRALVRFAPDARIADINALLDNYQASIVGGANGLFRLQFGNKAMSKDEVAGLLRKLRSEKIVSLAEAAP
jgi:anti-sigma factor RsiW